MEEDEVAEEEEEQVAAVAAEDFDTAAVGGIHERAQLCTIMEEDNESTAGSQLNLNNGGAAPMAAKRSSTLSNGNGVEGTEPAQQEVHDGHYFIKVCFTECPIACGLGWVDLNFVRVFHSLSNFSRSAFDLVEPAGKDGRTTRGVAIPALDPAPESDLW